MRIVQPTAALDDAYRDLVAELEAAGESAVPLIKDGTTFWFVDDSDPPRVIGTCRLRDELTKELWEHGGHVGYDIRPSERGKGHASQMVELLVAEAWDRGHPWLLVTVEDSNIASRRVAEKNGAVFLDRVHGTEILRYVIDRDADIVAVGGALTPGRVMDAYRRGVFPWPIEGENYWFSPDPRFVLYPDELHVSKSLEARIGSGRFEVRLDEDFDGVIAGCTRPEGWITEEYTATYRELHRQGHVHCAGAWRDGRLVGGLYGIAIGCVFYGESMFAREPDASKVAFAALVRQLKAWGFGLIDCQQETDHLASLGARSIPRDQFLDEMQGLQLMGGRGAPWRLERRDA